MSNLPMTIIGFADFLANLYVFLIIIRALMSWFPLSPDNPIMRFFARTTDPFLDWIRRWSPNLGMIDISPIIAIIIVDILVRRLMLPFLLRLLI